MIAERLAAVRERIAAAAARAGRRAEDVTLVAISKKHPPAAVREAYAAGQRDFGENYAQELVDKRAELADLPGARWHFVGRLQRNKAKDVAGATLIHAIDSLPLAEALARRVTAGGRQDVLVQVNLAAEASKGGVAPGDVRALVHDLAALPAIRCAGLMTMPPPAARADDNRPHFRALAALARELRLHELSMGMSDDFEVAIEEGATLVRIGTAIFGAR